MLRRPAVALAAVALATPLVLAAAPPAGASPSVTAASTATAPTATASTATAPTATAPSGAPKLVVTPTSGIVSGQSLGVVATGLQPRETVLAVQCTIQALTYGQDSCENRRNTVAFADASGTVHTTLVATVDVSTAVGDQSCANQVCVAALINLANPSDLGQALFTAISFAPGCPPGATGCGPTPSPAGPAAGSASPGSEGGAGHGARTISVGRPLSVGVVARRAGDLSTPSSITGPAGRAGAAGDHRGDADDRGHGDRPGQGHGHGKQHRDPRGNGGPATAGEGLVRLTLAAPGTSWASPTQTSVVVSVSVDGGAPQQMVLFDGVEPFTYAGFVGPLSTGHHQLSVAIVPSLSQVGSLAPTVRVLRTQLLVVSRDNPAYLRTAYAPVVYGRSTSAAHDTPLIADASTTALPDGSHRLTYVVIWSHEDAGTGFVPFLEWGEWGRMTDIETALTLVVSPSGAVSQASYLSCGCSATYPDTRSAPAEIDVPFTGAFVGNHPVLRDATGNNDFNQVGTTAFRFQQAVLPAPPAGQTRSSAMDTSPWTYRIMNEEVARWYQDVTTDPASPEPGDARQYATVDLDVGSSAVKAVGIDIRLAGSSKWYSNDFASGFPLFSGGHHRSVVKLPVDWMDQRITGLRLRVVPASPTSTFQVASLHVLGLTDGYQVVNVQTPSPQVVVTP